MSDNKLIFHYVLPGYSGLGGPLRFMLDDSGIEYVFDYIEWNDFVSKVKHQWIESGHPFDLAPMVEYRGKCYSGNMPLMRFISRKLGKYYIPDDDDLEQFIDCTMDYAMDWNRTHYEFIIRGKSGAEEYETAKADMFFSRFERVYGIHEGPFAAGEKITYADFYVFYVINLPLNRDFIKNYPRIAKFSEVMAAREALHIGIEDMKTKTKP